LVLIVLWMLYYKRPEESKKLSREELDYIQSDQEETGSAAQKVPWSSLLKHRQLWAVAAGKFFGDPIWWFYLTWLPSFFNTNKALDQKLDLKNIGLPFLIIYIVSDVGSIFFGWLSSRFIKNGWSPGRARKTTMLICALCVVPVVFASTTHSLFVAIALISLATAAHQGWSANVYTTSSDLFPKHTVGSVMGIAGMFGALSGVLFAATAGIIVSKFGYVPLFVIAASSYLVGLAIVHWLSPKWEKAKI
jgi:ACS family hexuronate transporter-like MFS transporter